MVKPEGFCIVFECDRNLKQWQWKPSYFTHTYFGSRRFRRIVWLCFGVAYIPVSLWQHDELVRAGRTEWVTNSN